MAVLQRRRIAPRAHKAPSSSAEKKRGGARTTRGNTESNCGATATKGTRSACQHRRSREPHLRVADARIPLWQALEDLLRDHERVSTDRAPLREHGRAAADERKLQAATRAAARRHLAAHPRRVRHAAQRDPTPAPTPPTHSAAARKERVRLGEAPAARVALQRRLRRRGGGAAPLEVATLAPSQRRPREPSHAPRSPPPAPPTPCGTVRRARARTRAPGARASPPARGASKRMRM